MQKISMLGIKYTYATEWPNSDNNWFCRSEFFFPKKLLSLKALASKTKDTEVEKHSA